MNISAYLGIPSLSDVGYQFYNANESANGSRIASGIIDAGGGWYSADATIPTNAASVRWDSLSVSSASAREYFHINGGFFLSKISEGSGTGQLDLNIGKVKIADGAINNNVLAADTGLKPARSGTAQGGGSNYITLDSGASSINDFYKYGIVLLTGGKAAGTFAIIETYNGLNKNATVSTPFVLSPDETTTFAILPLGGISTSAPTAEEIADAVASRVLSAVNPAATSNTITSAAGGSTFDFTGAALNLYGVVGNDLSMDVYFHNTDLTGYTFEGYIILEPAPLEKRYPLTVDEIDLQMGQIRVSLTENQTAEIGPITQKPWYIRWDGGSTSIVRNLLMGKAQLNRF